MCSERLMASAIARPAARSCQASASDPSKKNALLKVQARFSSPSPQSLSARRQHACTVSIVGLSSAANRCARLAAAKTSGRCVDEATEEARYGVTTAKTAR